MASCRCSDGTVLGIHPVPVPDRDGVPYEITLRLTRDGQPWADVGERCGWFLAGAATRLRAALESGSAASRRWPNPGDRFPMSSLEGGLRAWAVDAGLDDDDIWSQLQRYLPRDRDIFAFRHRDPDDVASAGELRCAVRVERTWCGGEGPAGGGGKWAVSQRAVLDAWDGEGRGVRAVLTGPELAALLDDLLTEASGLGCSYDNAELDVVARRPAG